MPADKGSCRSCGKAILWVVTTAGKRAPLDAARTVVIDDEGNSHTGHLSHFATCPTADQHRKAK